MYPRQNCLSQIKILHITTDVVSHKRLQTVAVGFGLGAPQIIFADDLTHSEDLFVSKAFDLIVFDATCGLTRAQRLIALNEQPFGGPNKHTPVLQIYSNYTRGELASAGLSDLKLTQGYHASMAQPFAAKELYLRFHILLPKTFAPRLPDLAHRTARRLNDTNILPLPFAS